jgi:HEAT repeat protein
LKSIADDSRDDKLKFLNSLESGDDTFLSNFDEDLKILVRDPDSEIRKKAISCLWDFPSKEAINLLFEILETERNEEVRSQIIVGFGRYVFELEDDEIFNDDELFDKYESEDDTIPRDDLIRVKEHLIKIYDDKTASVDERRFALESLGFSSDESIQELIEQAYESSNKKMKQSAIFAMGRTGLKIWDKTLLQELSNTDRELLIEAIKACGNGCNEKAGKKIEQLTHSLDREIALSAIWALGQIGYKDGFERLSTLSMSKDREIKSVAENALEEWFVANGQINTDEF